MRKTLIMILTLHCGGCGVFIPLNNKESSINDVRAGMAIDEVREILGEPDAVVLRADHVRSNVDIVCHRYRLYGKWTAVADLICGIWPFLTISWWIPLPWGSNNYYLTYADGKLLTWSIREEYLTYKQIEEWVLSARRNHPSTSDSVSETSKLEAPIK